MPVSPHRGDETCSPVVCTLDEDKRRVLLRVSGHGSSALLNQHLPAHQLVLRLPGRTSFCAFIHLARDVIGGSLASSGGRAGPETFDKMEPITSSDRGSVLGMEADGQDDRILSEYRYWHRVRAR